MDESSNSQRQLTAQKDAKDVAKLSWLDVEELSRYVSETGKIQSRQYTHLTAKNQRHVSKLIKRARNMLLMK
ncbi:MAG: 30S ribosomal protein S18 [Puniceicoccales bacterium]|jgi:small subunit ribosomal protein S18|nr:30S ribosomal protein S18 [Puniceicoccales bacterium]